MKHLKIPNQLIFFIALALIISLAQAAQENSPLGEGLKKAISANGNL